MYGKGYVPNRKSTLLEFMKEQMRTNVIALRLKKRRTA